MLGIISLIYITITFILSFLFLSLIFLFLNKQMIWLIKKNSPLKPLNVDELNETIEPYGFAYNLKNDSFYSIMNPWQRKYGYCKTYAEASPLLGMIIDSEPIHFEYDNRYWLIEFWKGQYGMTTGCEIGIYEIINNHSKVKEDSIYNCASDNERLYMFYTLKNKKDYILANCDLHWWLTGFKLGTFSKPSKLIMNIGITFKNNIMCESFIKGLKKVGYKDDEIKTSNMTVYLTFKKPHTKQPFTKNILTKFFVQKYNKFNCRFFNYITKDYNNSLDKINYIRERYPILYYQIIDFGKTSIFFTRNSKMKG